MSKNKTVSGNREELFQYLHFSAVWTSGQGPVRKLRPLEEREREEG